LIGGFVDCLLFASCFGRIAPSNLLHHLHLQLAAHLTHHRELLLVFWCMVVSNAFFVSHSLLFLDAVVIVVILLFCKDIPCNKLYLLFITLGSDIACVLLSIVYLNLNSCLVVILIVEIILIGKKKNKKKQYN
jgi:hypothetical protein